MEYLRAREQKLRDTNESTNERVKWFAFGTMGMLIGLGVWQVIYLRAYFRSVSDSADPLENYGTNISATGPSISSRCISLSLFYEEAKGATCGFYILRQNMGVSMHLLRAT
jgi:hypothetical protein